MHGMDYRPEGVGCESELHEFSLFPAKRDGSYKPGDTVRGHILLKPAQGIELISLKVAFYGAARVKARVKGVDPKNERMYLQAETELLQSDITVPAEEERSFSFEQKLPMDLPTSIESRTASILYVIRSQLQYRTEENVIKALTSICGFTVVEQVDLNSLPPHFFDPPDHQLVKKFGIFSCTGGHIKLTFAMKRTAFVCGENITIEGRIENKTDRRVDKVAAVLQQVVVVHGAPSADNQEELNLLDVYDIHDDNLALFVDEGASTKIERNFAIPPLPPSTYHPGDGERLGSASSRNRRMSLNAARLSFSSVNQKLPSSPSRQQRFLRILYQLCVKVKTGGVEVMEINVPIIIGTIPKEFNAKEMSELTVANLTVGSDGHLGPPSSTSKRVMFRQNRKERPVQLSSPNEVYICNKAQLTHVNRYPFYVDLPTSSKQSRKISMLASVVKTEANVLAKLRQLDASKPSTASTLASASPEEHVVVQMSDTVPIDSAEQLPCFVPTDDAATPSRV